MSKVEEWPEALDALRSAPGYHTLVFENELVRVLEIHVPPGETVPLHTHQWPAVLYIRSWSDFVRRDSEGRLWWTAARLEGRRWRVRCGPGRWGRIRSKMSAARSFGC